MGGGGRCGEVEAGVILSTWLVCVAFKKKKNYYQISSHCNTLDKLVQILENICFKYNSFVKS